MIEFIGTSLQLQPIMTAHNQWLFTTRCFLPGLRASSLPLWQMTKDEPLLTLNCLQWRLSDESFVRVVSYVTTDGQLDSLSWNKTPIWGLRPDFYYCRTVACLLMWDTLSDERTGLSNYYVLGHYPSSRLLFAIVTNLWTGLSFAIGVYGNIA
jgi:hypothetical protein